MRFSDLTPNKQAAATGGLTGLISGAIIYVLSQVLGIDVDAETAAAIGTIVAFIAGLISRAHLSALLPIILLLTAGIGGILPSVAHAQEAVPAKLLELETIEAPSLPASGSWTVATGATTLYVSGADSARVYFGSDDSRAIIATVGGTSYVLAPYFGWFRVDAVRLASYNAIQTAVPTDWNYINFDPLALAFTVAVSRDGPSTLPKGAVLPRSVRLSHETD